MEYLYAIYMYQVFHLQSEPNNLQKYQTEILHYPHILILHKMKLLLLEQMHQVIPMIIEALAPRGICKLLCDRIPLQPQILAYRVPG